MPLAAVCAIHMIVSAGAFDTWRQVGRLLLYAPVTFVTVHDSYRNQVAEHNFYVVNDANRWSKIALLKAAGKLAWIVWNEKPDIVISTGAAPGYLALRMGRLIGARTIWLDSIANVEQLSMSGSRIGRFADLWLTQWPHLTRPGGPYYAGSVL